MLGWCLGEEVLSQFLEDVVTVLRGRAIWPWMVPIINYNSHTHDVIQNLDCSLPSETRVGLGGGGGERWR